MTILNTFKTKKADAINHQNYFHNRHDKHEFNGM